MNLLGAAWWHRHLVHVIMLAGPLVVLAALAGGLVLSDPQRRARRPVDASARVALAIAWVAGAVIHLSVIREHFAEATALGLFFCVLAAGQLAYAGLLLARPSRALLVAGMAGNAAVVVLWTYSRTVDVPFGFGGREPVGGLDLACTLLEVAALLVAAVVVRRADRRVSPAVGGLWVTGPA